MIEIINALSDKREILSLLVDTLPAVGCHYAAKRVTAMVDKLRSDIAYLENELAAFEATAVQVTIHDRIEIAA